MPVPTRLHQKKLRRRRLFLVFILTKPHWPMRLCFVLRMLPSKRHLKVQIWFAFKVTLRFAFLVQSCTRAAYALDPKMIKDRRFQFRFSGILQSSFILIAFETIFMPEVHLPSLMAGQTLFYGSPSLPFSFSFSLLELAR